MKTNGAVDHTPEDWSSGSRAFPSFTASTSPQDESSAAHSPPPQCLAIFNLPLSTLALWLLLPSGWEQAGHVSGGSPYSAIALYSLRGLTAGAGRVGVRCAHLWHFGKGHRSCPPGPRPAVPQHAQQVIVQGLTSHPPLIQVASMSQHRRCNSLGVPQSLERGD